MTELVRVVGSGLTAATVAFLLRDQGFAVEVFDDNFVWGGQIRTEQASGIFYEPRGAHIFHTRDEEVWRFISRMAPFRAYRHRVRAEVNDRLLSWPIQIGELRALPEWRTIEEQLHRRPTRPRKYNFETWCLDLVGPTLYRWFIEPYTRKQWGCDPRELSATWAPKRIELRDDGYLDLFRDPYQGWPVGGYLPLLDRLISGCSVLLGVRIDAASMADLMSGACAVVLTLPLDDFFGDSMGALPWRGVRLVHRYYPDVERILPCSVVNHPGLDKGYTRRIETKWMSGQTGPGTVVSEEYPGAPLRHYPIVDAAGRNRALAQEYVQLVSREFGPKVHVAGRLATYSYIDMDQAVRQGINAAARIARQGQLP